MSAALAFYAVWALPYKGGAEQLGPVCPDAWQNQAQTAGACVPRCMAKPGTDVQAVLLTHR